LNGTLTVSTATVVTTPTAVPTTMAAQPCSISNTATTVNVFNTELLPGHAAKTAALIMIIPGTGYMCDSRCKTDNTASVISGILPESVTHATPRTLHAQGSAFASTATAFCPKRVLHNNSNVMRFSYPKSAHYRNPVRADQLGKQRIL